MPQDIDYLEPPPETPAVSRVPHKDHAQACLTGKFGKLKPLLRPEYAHLLPVQFVSSPQVARGGEACVSTLGGTRQPGLV